MTDLELLEKDPMTLDGDMLTKWEHAQKKAMRINKVYKAQLEEKISQAEMEARDFMAKRNIKVANLENMEATIRMEDLYEDYQNAIEKASARVKGIQDAYANNQTETPPAPFTNSTNSQPPIDNA